jgi:hypothetical protein
MRGEFLEPGGDVFDQAVFVVVDVDGGGDVHGRDEAEAVDDAAALDDGLDLRVRCTISNKSPPGRSGA